MLPDLHACTARSLGLQDPVYLPYLGQLAKLGFFASGIHQAVFAFRCASDIR